MAPGTVLSGYRHGLFPMRVHTRTVGWWSPDPRGVLPLDELHVSRSLRRSLTRYRVTIDHCFAAVMLECATTRREGNWINEQFIRTYGELHRLGWAHSVETWDDNDQLVGVALTDGEREIILVSSGGKAIRFNENEVRHMGREATGVRGIRLGDGQDLIALIVVGEGHVLSASASGYGKLTPLEDFPSHGRGGQGVIALQTSDRNGITVAALQVMAGQQIMLISSSGTLVRTTVDEISVQGRNTQGVRLIRMDEGERLVGIERIESLESGEEGAALEHPAGTDAGEPAADS